MSPSSTAAALSPSLPPPPQACWPPQTRTIPPRSAASQTSASRTSTLSSRASRSSPASPSPFQTTTTVQHSPNNKIIRLAERSLDPRDLAAAILAAVKATDITLQEDTPLAIHSTLGSQQADEIVYATGAWFTGAWLTGAWRTGAKPRLHPLPAYAPPIHPRKGQMMRVRIPRQLDLHEVHRSASVYIVPRTLGLNAGTALIGATIEDAGFDKTVHQADLDHLRTLAAALIPALASAADSPVLESWAGLRPFTTDGLPILGRASNAWLATGHFRNGILLAPGTAIVLADLIEGRASPRDLTPFRPDRFY